MKTIAKLAETRMKGLREKLHGDWKSGYRKRRAYDDE